MPVGKTKSRRIVMRDDKRKSRSIIYVSILAALLIGISLILILFFNKKDEPIELKGSELARTNEVIEENTTEASSQSGKTVNEVKEENKIAVNTEKEINKNTTSSNTTKKSTTTNNTKKTETSKVTKKEEKKEIKFEEPVKGEKSPPENNREHSAVEGVCTHILRPAHQIDKLLRPHVIWSEVSKIFILADKLIHVHKGHDAVSCLFLKPERKLPVTSVIPKKIAEYIPVLPDGSFFPKLLPVLPIQHQRRINYNLRIPAGQLFYQLFPGYLSH